MYLRRTGEFAGPVLTPPILEPGYSIRGNFSLIDVIETGVEEFAGCLTTPAANLQLLDSYPRDNEAFYQELSGLYIDHLTAHAEYIGDRAVSEQKKCTPRDQPEQVPPSTIQALAIGSVLLHGQILRIEGMEARFGQAGGKKPWLHAITKTVHYKDGPLQRLVKFKSPGTFLHAEHFVEATNQNIMVAAKNTIMAVESARLGNADSDHRPESVTRAVITRLVSEQVATERDIFNEAVREVVGEV